MREVEGLEYVHQVLGGGGIDYLEDTDVNWKAMKKDLQKIC